MTEGTKGIYNGGPAFPLDLKVGDDHRWSHGMSLRDYFASQAIIKLLENMKEQSIDELVNVSYAVADSMIERRMS